MANLTDAQSTLSKLGAIRWLGHIQEAIKTAYPGNSSGQFKPPEAVAWLVTQLTLAGLERRLLDKGADVGHGVKAAGRLSLAVADADIEKAAILAAMSLNTGVLMVYDPDTGGQRMANWLNLPPMIPGERSLEDGFRGEVLAGVIGYGSRRPGAALPNVKSFRQWVRQNGLPDDDVIADYAARYEKETGVKFVVGLRDDPASSASSLPPLSPDLLDIFCVRAFIFHGPASANDPIRKRLAEIALYLDGLAGLLYPRPPSQAPSSGNP